MSATGGMGGGRRSVNTELNLVPFIDLLSTLICFLLITAVWAQISVLSTNSASTTSSDTPPPPTDEKKVDLSVSLLLDRVEATEGTQVTKIVHINGEPDYSSLLNLLDTWKIRYPERSDMVIYSDSQAAYKRLIRIMDTLAEARFDDVGVHTN